MYFRSAEQMNTGNFRSKTPPPSNAPSNDKSAAKPILPGCMSAFAEQKLRRKCQQENRALLDYARRIAVFCLLLREIRMDAKQKQLEEELANLLKHAAELVARIQAEE